MKKAVQFVLSFLLLNLSLCSGDVYSFNELIEQAIKNSPVLRESREMNELKREELRYSDSFPAPRVEFGWQLSSVETRVGPQKANLRLVQSLPWKSKREIKRQMSLKAQKAQEYLLQDEQLKLVAEIESLRAEFYFLEKQKTYLQAEMEWLDLMEKSLQARLPASPVLNADLSRVQLERMNLEEALLELSDKEYSKLARLSYLTGKEVQQVRTVSELPVIPPQDETENYKSNYSYLAKREVAERAGRQEELAKKAWFPDPVFSLTWIMTDNSLMQVEDNGKDPLIAGIGFSIPIQFGKIRSEIRAGELEKKAKQSEANAFLLKLQADIESVRLKRQSLLRRMKWIEEKLLPTAEKIAESLREGYLSGRAGFRDMIDSQRKVLQLRIEREEVLSKSYALAVTYNRLTGRRGDTR